MTEEVCVVMTEEVMTEEVCVVMTEEVMTEEVCVVMTEGVWQVLRGVRAREGGTRRRHRAKLSLHHLWVWVESVVVVGAWQEALGRVSCVATCVRTSFRAGTGSFSTSRIRDTPSKWVGLLVVVGWRSSVARPQPIARREEKRSSHSYSYVLRHRRFV